MDREFLARLAAAYYGRERHEMRVKRLADDESVSLATLLEEGIGGVDPLNNRLDLIPPTKRADDWPAWAGKGRRHATDGGLWDAAAFCAAASRLAGRMIYDIVPAAEAIAAADGSVDVDPAVSHIRHICAAYALTRRNASSISPSRHNAWMLGERVLMRHYSPVPWRAGENEFTVREAAFIISCRLFEAERR